MGKYDSSRTRVAPIFNWLYSSDVSGVTWLPKLLGLVGAKIKNPSSGKLTKAFWWPREAALPAPRGLLNWLVEHCEEPRTSSALGSEVTALKRRSLLKRNKETVHDALTALATTPSAHAWYILEGPSCPDAYLETKDVIVLIEGKRTERHPTTRTSWMQERHQMLRHLDAAWDSRNGQQLIGLMIVEGIKGNSEVPPPWNGYRESLNDEHILARSLPHRSPEERQAILGCFAGITTWKAVTGSLEIPEAVMIQSLRAGGK